MINNTLVPILVFIVLFIPPIALGFFRGWKASFFIMALILLFIAIEVIITIPKPIYNWLWNIFSKFYISDLQPGLNNEGLKDISKPSVVILWIGVCMVPSYLIVFGIYFSLKGWLLKHLYPKTTKIDENSKEIKRSMHWVSRTVGVVISTTSSLFFASSASTAAAVLFTDKDSKNGFTDFTNRMTKIYTFGKGGYSHDLLVAREFAKNYLTPNQQFNLMKVFYLGTQDDIPNTIKAFNNLSSGIFNEKLVELAKNPNAFIAIVGLILTAQGSPASERFFPYDNGYQKLQYDENGIIVVDNKGNPVFEKEHIPYSDMTVHLKTFLNMPDLNLHLSDSVISQVISYIKSNQFKNYKDTGFYKQWEDGVDLHKVLQARAAVLENQKITLKRQYNELKIKLARIYSDIKTKEDRISILGMSANSVGNVYSTVHEGGTKYDVTLTLLGEIHSLEEKITDLQKQLVIEKTEQKNSNDKFLGTGTTKGTQEENSDNESAYNSSKIAKEIIENTLSRYKTTLNNIINSLVRAHSERDEAFKDYEKITNQQINTHEQNSVDAKIEADTLQQTLNQKNTDLKEIQRMISQLFIDKEHLEDNVKINQQIVDSIINDPIALKNAQDDLDTAKSNLANNSKNIDSKNLEIETLSREITKIEKSVSDKNILSSNEHNESIRLANKKNGYKDIYESQDVLIGSLNTQKSDTMSNIASKEQEFIGANSKYLADKNTYDTFYQSTYLPDKTIFNLNNRTVEKTEENIRISGLSLSSKETNKLELISGIKELISQREVTLIDIYSNSDFRNILENKDIIDTNGDSTHRDEKFYEGKDKIPPIYDDSKTIQTKSYYDYSRNTIPGIKNYIKNIEDNTDLLKVIKDEEEIKYNKFIEDYLNVIENLLKS